MKPLFLAALSALIAISSPLAQARTLSRNEVLAPLTINVQTLVCVGGHVLGLRTTQLDQYLTSPIGEQILVGDHDCSTLDAYLEANAKSGALLANIVASVSEDIIIVNTCKRRVYCEDEPTEKVIGRVENLSVSLPGVTFKFERKLPKEN